MQHLPNLAGTTKYYMKRILLSIAIISLFLATKAEAAVYSENFDSYSTGAFTNGTGGWTTVVNTGASLSVSTSQFHSSPKSLAMGAGTANSGINRSIASSTSGRFTTYIYVSGTSSNCSSPTSNKVISTFAFTDSIHSSTQYVICNDGSIYGDLNTHLFNGNSVINFGAWNKVDVDFAIASSTLYERVGINSVFSAWTIPSSSGGTEAMNKVTISTGDQSITNYVDDISYATNGDTPFNPDFDNTTHIVSFSPEEGTTTSNPVTFSLHAYVAEEDIGNFLGVKFTLHNIDQNVLLLSAFSNNDIYFLDGFQATTSGDFFFSTTTTVGEGNYRINAILERSYAGGWIVNPFSPINQDLSHQFIVGQGTYIGNISQNSFSEFNRLFASTTATSTSANAGNCIPLGNFDPTKCGAFLFVPDAGYLDFTIKNLRSGVLTRFPWGYFNRMYSIWQDPATSTLPSFTVSFMTGSGSGTDMATNTLNFDMDDMIVGGGNLLESIKDPITGQSTRDIVEPWLLLIIGVGVLYTIIQDLTGSHGHQPEGTQDKKTKLS